MTRNPSDESATRQRQPMTWPMAVVLVALFILAGFGVWICGGVATNIWGS